MLLSVPGSLFPEEKDDPDHSERQARQTEHREHPGSAGAGLRQVEAAGVDDGEGHKGVDRALVGLHVHVIRVHRGAGRQQTVLEMLLRHVVVQTGIDIGIARIVLQQTEHVRAVDAAQGIALGGSDHDPDAVLEERVGVIRAHLGHRVVVVLQTLDLQIAGGGGDKVGGVRLGLGVTGHIVEAVALHLRLDKVAVRVVAQDELDLGEVALAVRESLGQVDAVGIHMAVVHEGVVVAGVAALPGHHNRVVVAVVAVDRQIIGAHGGLVGDAQGAVGIAGVDHVNAGIDAAAGVDLGKTGVGHVNGHHVVAVGKSVVGHMELTVLLAPGADLVGAAVVMEKLQNHVVLVVAQASGQSIHEGIDGQIGCCGGNAGQRGDDLIVDRIAG